MLMEHVWQKLGRGVEGDRAEGTKGHVQEHTLLRGQSSLPAETLKLLGATQST